MYYIQFKYENNALETIDELETRKEAQKMLREYLMAYKGVDCRLYISTRACKEWREN